MTVTGEEDLERLRAIGHVCAMARDTMAAALQPGITTAELDAIGARVLALHGARSAPQLAYDFPGVTCISVNEEIAHGIPGDRVIAAGDLVNIDVSAELDGIYADTGASYVVPEADPALAALCRDGKRAMWEGIRAVRSDAPLAGIGNAIGAFAKKHRYTLIQNLASHGVGDTLHDEPGEIRPGPTVQSAGQSQMAWCLLSSHFSRSAAARPSNGATTTGPSSRVPRRRVCSSNTLLSRPAAALWSSH